MSMSIRSRLSVASGMIAATVLAGLLASAPASASASEAGAGAASSAVDAICHEPDVYVNVSSSVPSLNRYSVASDGAATLVSSTPLAEDYGDLALSADGTSLYAITLFSNPALHRIDQSTGAVEAVLPVVFDDGSRVEGFNALSLTADGDLYASSYLTDRIAVIDPDTGAARWISSFPVASTGESLRSAGDFLTLDDGTVLGLATSPRGGYLVRFDFVAGTTTIVGTTPIAYGAAQSGGRIHLATAGGELLSIDEVPQAASEDPVATTVRASTGLTFYGATSSQDSLGCLVPVLDIEKTLTGHVDADESDSVTPGDTLNFRVVGTNRGTALLSDVTVSDPLTGDAKTCELLDVGQSCELLTAYVVTPEDAARGSIDNIGVADSDQTTPVNGTVTTVVEPRPQIAPAPSGDEGPQPGTPAPERDDPRTGAEAPTGVASPSAPAPDGEFGAAVALAETGVAAPIGGVALAAVLLAAGGAILRRRALSTE